jgi:hypothetical protein
MPGIDFGLLASGSQCGTSCNFCSSSRSCGVENSGVARARCMVPGIPAVVRFL